MELIDIFSLKKLFRLVGLQETIPRLWYFLCSSNNKVMMMEGESASRVNELGKFDDVTTGSGRQVTVSREDVADVVMERLGFRRSQEEEEEAEEGDFSEGEIERIFEVKEATLEEVREAFEVFDENRDGFIDAKELQRVLCVLGFEEGLELQRCSLMIKAFDQNGDEKIDLHEFLLLLENCI
ncbi:hypothetical protein Dimus_002896 [Dionaea muscipula]